MSQATSDICEATEEKQAQAKMSDSKNGAAEEMPAGVKNLISFNHEYEKIICSGSGCGSIELEQLGQYLGRKHRVSAKIAGQVARVARKLGWEEKLWGDERPEDSMALQVGLPVWDGFRCKQCHYVSVIAEDVDDHWDYQQHDMWVGRKAEKVRFQSWDGSFYDGFSNEYWVVDESRTRDRGEDGSEGLELGGSKAGCGEVVHGDVEWVVV
ncbi:hypothetical protein V502_01873 [Pseudogymnoascus sp. VKM F-4520 (FW-2644)]|nr:hypothetical protein V502_01873 [Pseudogymnoascus sp. VKM F-4520 (FW-2644)]